MGANISTIEPIYTQSYKRNMKSRPWADIWGNVKFMALKNI